MTRNTSISKISSSTPSAGCYLLLTQWLIRHTGRTLYCRASWLKLLPSELGGSSSSRNSPPEPLPRTLRCSASTGPVGVVHSRPTSARRWMLTSPERATVIAHGNCSCRWRLRRAMVLRQARYGLRSRRRWAPVVTASRMCSGFCPVRQPETCSSQYPLRVRSCTTACFTRRLLSTCGSPRNDSSPAAGTVRTIGARLGRGPRQPHGTGGPLT